MDTRVLPGIDDRAIDHFLALEDFAERLHEWPIEAVGHIRRQDGRHSQQFGCAGEGEQAALRLLWLAASAAPSLLLMDKHYHRVCRRSRISTPRASCAQR